MFQPAESDDFCSVELGLQWQWQGVPSPYWYFVGPGAADEDCTNGALKLVDTQDGVVLQAVECKDALEGSSETLLSSIPLRSEALPLPYSDRYMSTTVPPVAPLAYCECNVWVKMSVEQKSRPGNVPDAICNFEYSLDGKKWAPLPDKDYSFTARQGKWIGAKFGFFCNRHASKNDGGWLRIDWVKVTD